MSFQYNPAKHGSRARFHHRIDYLYIIPVLIINGPSMSELDKNGTHGYSGESLEDRQVQFDSEIMDTEMMRQKVVLLKAEFVDLKYKIVTSISDGRKSKTEQQIRDMMDTMIATQADAKRIFTDLFNLYYSRKDIVNMQEMR